MTVRIVTDSSACVPPDLVERYGIEIVPIRVALGGIDRPVVEVERRRIIDRLVLGERVTTSAPSPGAFLRALEAADEGDGVVLLTLASTMSSTYGSAKLAVSQAACSVRLVDTGTAAGGLGLVTLAAARTATQDASLDQVEETARAVAGRVRLVAVVGSLQYLARSGRVRDSASSVGDALGLKPLFEFREGQVRLLRPSLSRPGARERVLHQWRDSRPAGAARLHVTALHADDPDEAEALLTAVADTVEPATAFASELDVAMIAHTGPDLVGLAWWWEEDRDAGLQGQTQPRAAVRSGNLPVSKAVRTARPSAVATVDHQQPSADSLVTSPPEGCGGAAARSRGGGDHPVAAQAPVGATQPLTSGPVRSIAMRTSTRCSRRIAWRYSSQFSCSPATCW